NEECGLALSDIIGANTQRVYLAHLSQDNNMKDLARMSVGYMLAERGIETELFVTDPKTPTNMYEVGRYVQETTCRLAFIYPLGECLFFNKHFVAGKTITGSQKPTRRYVRDGVL